MLLTKIGCVSDGHFYYHVEKKLEETDKLL